MTPSTPPERCPVADTVKDATGFVVSQDQYDGLVRACGELAKASVRWETKHDALLAQHTRLRKVADGLEQSLAQVYASGHYIPHIAQALAAYRAAAQQTQGES
jgi:hypothetical protein